ncbi:MAG: O-antigen ligase family protein [Candidatus Kapabacteria bacterium]|nr:O-antigen ligase family protein [Candidatus Kapabacteria bacterium]
MVRFPRVWLGVFLLALPVFLTDTGKGISVTEAVGGSVFTLAIILWMLWRLALDPRPLIKGWTDFLLLFFIVAAFANVIVAKLNNVDLVDWGVDWSYFLLMLYYFPFREEFGKDNKSFGIFLSLAAVSSSLMAIHSAYTFKQKLAENVVYAYQIMSGRSAMLGPIFLLCICVAAVIIIQAEWKTKIVATIVLLLNLVALGLTFTRTLWILVLPCIMLAMLFMHKRQNIRLVLGAIGTVVVMFAVGFVINPKIAVITAKFVESRIASSSQLSGGDHSFETRLLEASNAWRKVKESPIGGNGLRARFVTWAPIEQWHNSTAFVHIGYVGLIHKLGFPTAFILFAVLIGFSYRGLMAAIRARHPSAPPLVRSVAIGVFAFIPAMYVNIFMAGIFDQRYGNVMFAFIFMSVAMSENLLRQARLEFTTQQLP